VTRDKVNVEGYVRLWELTPQVESI